MVRLAAAVAINSAEDASQNEVAETDELQEQRIHAKYQEALEMQHAGDTASAEVRCKTCIACHFNLRGLMSGDRNADDN